MKRRNLLLTGTGLLAAGGIAYWQRNPLLRSVLTNRTNEATATLAPAIGDDVCVLTPKQVEGPYYFESPVRSDITEDLPGLPLDLNIEITNVSNCTPLSEVGVEVWHCDSAGAYSGYGGDLARAPFDTLTAIPLDGHIKRIEDTTYLRGGQFTNDQGLVQFKTIFPGWYDPRATHIHVRVSQGDKVFLTTQLYFLDELTKEIYREHPDYKNHGDAPYNLTNDIALADLANRSGLILNTQRTADKIIANARFGIES